LRTAVYFATYGRKKFIKWTDIFSELLLFVQSDEVNSPFKVKATATSACLGLALKCSQCLANLLEAARLGWAERRHDF
jgi:hypothetical protein